jgi:segregation and condensation protein A
VVADDVKVDDRLEHILGMLSEGGEVRFEELFADDLRRIALVATFMAVLELVKMQRICLRQESRFGAIFVSARPDGREETGGGPGEASLESRSEGEGA